VVPERLRLIRHAALAVASLLTLMVVMNVVVLPWGLTAFAGKAGTLAGFANAIQAAVLLVFAVIIGLFIHRYAEPFFILWYFGWLSWLGLYGTRLLHASWGQVFNPINSSFLFLAGILLVAPRGWTARIARFPQQEIAHGVGAPLWLCRYVRANPLALLAWSPVLVLAVIRHASPDSYSDAENAWSVVAITAFGVGLYWRMRVISPDSALVALLVHAVYLEPHVSRLVWPAAELYTLQHTLSVALPTLVMKPALALLVTFLALRETGARHEKAERDLARVAATAKAAGERTARVLAGLPDACLLVKDGLVTFMNPRACELLGLASESAPALASIFSDPQACDVFMERLREEDRVLGYETETTVRSRVTAIPARVWVRLDAFSIRPAQSGGGEEIVILILDRHERELAHAVYSLAHDYMKPRLHHLSGRLRQQAAQIAAWALPAPLAVDVADGVEQKICSELLGVLDLLRDEFRNYWIRRQVDDRADVRNCVKVAWAQARHACEGELDCQPMHEASFAPEAGDISAAVSDHSLTRALTNAYINAIRATYKREQRTRLSPVQTSVALTEGWVFIRICDRGGGFKSSILSFINDRPAAAPPEVGVGLLGLKLVVAAAGGSVHAGNGPEGGAWVKILLPTTNVR
jgi:PAS domain-containing protein